MTPLLRPLIFYPVCVVIGAVLGFVIIGSGLLPANAGAPVSTETSRNDERTRTLKTVSSAIKKYVADRKQLPYRLPPGLTEICVTNGETCSSRHLVDLSYLVSSNYLENLPNDPIGGHTEYGTGYFIAQTADGTLYLKAARAEAGKTIELVE